MPFQTQINHNQLYYYQRKIVFFLTLFSPKKIGGFLARKLIVSIRWKREPRQWMSSRRGVEVMNPALYRRKVFFVYSLEASEGRK